MDRGVTPCRPGKSLAFRARGPQDEELGEAEGSFTHRSPPEPASIRVPAAGAGVYEVEVDSPRWYGWSEPSMPTVLAGAPTADGGARFSLMLALGRHWFFGVPEGTEEFLVRVELADPNHALQVEINAPDRIVQVLYAQGGAPAGGDGACSGRPRRKGLVPEVVGRQLHPASRSGRRQPAYRAD